MCEELPPEEDEMMSSIREMSCGHPIMAASLGWRGAVGPCMAAQLTDHCHGSLQPPGSCHIPLLVRSTGGR